MVKKLLSAILPIVLLASCSSLKSLNFTANRPVAHSTDAVKEPASTPKKETKFLEEIAITPSATPETQKEEKAPERSPVTVKETTAPVKEEPAIITDPLAYRTRSVETASSVQLKYAVLLNTEVEMLPSKELLETVDDWYGVRYRKGGNTKGGVDCSGFTLAVYSAVYGVTLPRISRDQYRMTRHISTTELQEGDLLFFDTRGRGSISHVGVYLGNNKFIHASVSRGVMVSGMFEPYYLQRFVGAGRVDTKSIVGSR